MAVIGEKRHKYIEGSNRFLDSPALALSNILAGDPATAARAFWDPQSLVPEERRSVADRLGLAGTPLASLTDIVTNPLVLMGIVGSLVWKLPTAAQRYTWQAQEAMGAAKRFPGLDLIAPSADLYRGTGIYDQLSRAHRTMMSLRQDWYPKFEDAIQKYLKSVGRQTLSEQESLTLTAMMGNMGQATGKGAQPEWAVLRKSLQKKLDNWEKLPGLSESDLKAGIEALENPMPGLAPTPELIQLVSDLQHERGIMREIYETAWATATDKKNFADAHAARRFRGGGVVKRYTEEEAAEMAKFEASYFSKMQKMDPREQAENLNTYLQRAKQTGAEVGEVKVDTKHFLDREHGWYPTAGEFLKAGGDPRLAKVLAALESVEGPGYTLDANHWIPRYVDSMIKSTAFNGSVDGGKPVGRLIASELNEITKGTHKGFRLPDGSYDKHRAAFVAGVTESTYVPILSGRYSVTQQATAQMFAGARAAASRLLQSDTMLGKALGEEKASKLRDLISYSPSGTLPNVSDNIARFFNASTLGLNTLSPGFNLLQNVSTLAPTIGWDNVARGAAEITKRFGEVVKAYGPVEKGGAGKGFRLAFQRIFEEFHDSGLELTPGARSEFLSLLERQADDIIKLPGSLSKNIEKAEQAMLTLFTTSEQANRMLAFYGSRAWAKRSLKVGDEVRDILTNTPMKVTKENFDSVLNTVAREHTLKTQFGSGPLNRPFAMTNIPSALSQFTTFPMRMAHFVATADPATLSRMALGAGIAGGAAHEFFGADISRGLVAGGIPTPTDMGMTPFAPLPIVPPALQVAGAGLAALGGNSEPLRQSLPLMVPGGIQLARATTALPGAQPVAEFIGRPYADYQNRTSDGRIPVYSKDGALQGYYTDAQLWAKAVGLPNATPNAEAQVLQMLLKNRDRIRAMKQDYLTALYQNDAADAQAIAEKYEQMFPRMGGIPVTKADIASLHKRKDVSRLERTLETLPANLKEQYTRVVGVALGTQGPGFLGLTSEFTPGTVGSRDPFRTRDAAETSKRVSQGLHGVGLRDKMRAAGVESAYQKEHRYAADNYLSGFPEPRQPRE